jgi:hypothetical protein
MGINKGDHAGYRCHRRRGQQVCWTYLSQLGILMEAESRMRPSGRSSTPRYLKD